MHQPSNRDKKAALGSLKQILQNYVSEASTFRKQTTLTNEDGELQSLLGKMRSEKLRSVFMQKMNRVNIYQSPIQFKLLSKKQKDDARFFQLKGINTNGYLLSAIYILDFLFVLVTFIIGTLIAWLDDFRISGDHTSTTVIALMIIAIVITCFKILATSVTITIDNGIVLVYLTDILKNYILTFVVFIDLAYLIVVLISLCLGNEVIGLGAAIFAISIIKLISLGSNLQSVETVLIDSFKKQQYSNLLQVALFNIFFAHFLASILLSMARMDDTYNWMIAKAINQLHWYEQYAWAYYWACTIMLTIGFGDFLAFTPKQAAVVACMELLSCIVVAYNISAIGNIISAIRQPHLELNRKMGVFHRMAEKNDINHQLTRRIQAYLKEENQIMERFEFKQQSALLSELPENLKQQYIIEANQQLFADLPFFKNLQKGTLVEFAQAFTSDVFYPGQFITRPNDQQHSIMILKQGKVGLAYRKYGSYLNGTIVQDIEIKPREVYDQQSNEIQQKEVPVILNTDFLSLCSSEVNYDIVAQKYSLVLILKQTDFLQILNKSKIDSSYFYGIKHKHTMVNNQWAQVECQLCSVPASTDTEKVAEGQRIFHTKFQCSKLHYFPLRSVVIMKKINDHGLSQNRDSSQIIRKRRRIKTSLMMRKGFFKPYEKARNLHFVKSSQPSYGELVQHQEANTQQKQGWKFCGHDEKENHPMKYHQIKKQGQSLDWQPESTQQLNNPDQVKKLIRSAIEESLTGYRPDFWQLQIDEGHNYTNYFPNHNPKILDFTPLNKGPEGQRSRKPFKTILEPLMAKRGSNIQDNHVGSQRQLISESQYDNQKYQQRIEGNH